MVISFLVFVNYLRRLDHFKKIVVTPAKKVKRNKELISPNRKRRAEYKELNFCS